MSARLRGILYLSAGLVCLPGLAQAQAGGLKHDPFVRPVLAAPPPPAVAAPVNRVVKAALPEPVWKPELTAIMLAGAKSMVNVGGELVRIGEQINGYRLVEVQEETAVFVNDKKRVTLSLRAIEPLRPPRQDERELQEEHRDAPPSQDGTNARREAPRSQDDSGTNARRDAPPSQDNDGPAQTRGDTSKPEVK
jgi:hypothetical protein